jgi:hypothetical protein
LKQDSELAVRTAGGNEFQQSADLLKKQEENLVERLVGLSKIGRGVLHERMWNMEIKEIVTIEKS